MVFDAHDRAFAFFKGACTRGICDNMKTAVETILVGRERAYNRRFLQMCGHRRLEPETVASRYLAAARVNGAGNGRAVDDTLGTDVGGEKPTRRV